MVTKRQDAAGAAVGQQEIRRARVAELRRKLRARGNIKAYDANRDAIQAEITRLENVIADVDAHVLT